ncbi:MAG: LuxR C-terminal-related transcriptional regulator, partial [Desulfovermiculus sp.]
SRIESGMTYAGVTEKAKSILYEWRLALGSTNKEIASTYDISVKTVDTYRLRLLRKLNLRNNVDLSRFAMQHKLL